MKCRFFPWILTLCFMIEVAAAQEWTSQRTKAEMFNGRMTEWFSHDSKPEWNSQNPDQKDMYIVVHPKDEAEKPIENRPLYVVFHSAGHSAQTALECTSTPGNHDIYHVPDGFFGLFIDCYANRDTDWWWGGLRADETVDDSNRARASGELQPVEKRIEDTIRRVMTDYSIDPNRVYGCGNSMGGSGVLGFGLRHGNIFAAIKANVPAGVKHAAARMLFPFDGSPSSDDNAASIPTGIVLTDPPICIDYSGTNDQWSDGHEILFAGMKSRHYPLIAYWGNFGHENNHDKIKKVNDLIDTFDWLSVRRNEAYPVFTNASSDSKIPWPKRESATEPGQVNAFFRWKNQTDATDVFQMSLFLTDAKELGSTIFTVPTEATADVSLRRLQQFQIQSHEEIGWTFGEYTGTVCADATGVITIPTLNITTQPKTLTLSKSVGKKYDLSDSLKQIITINPTAPATAPIMVTEQQSSRILILKANTDWNQPDAMVWEWDPAKSPDIAPGHVSWFSNCSEAKPVRGTDQLLTVASGGGVALVRLADHKVLFYALAGGNTHSAALLPDGNIVTASSTGNYMKLFIVSENFTGPDTVQNIEYPFTDTHGLVWDNAHQTLWVLGGQELASYAYRGSKAAPVLEQTSIMKLPSQLKGGHDLYPVPRTNVLFVTGEKGIGLFDTETRQLIPIAAIENIKSISSDEVGNILAQQPKEMWWSDSILYLNGNHGTVGTLNGAKFYKARWWISEQLNEKPSTAVFHPGELWLDNQGLPINAHGGGILFHEGKYWWFGEHKTEGTEGNTAQVGVHCYSSSNLYDWADEGIALQVSDDPNSDITRGSIIERPKVLYNEKTRKFVMWFHLERKSNGYTDARCGVATADQIAGPYTFIHSVRPNVGTWPLNSAESERKQPTQEEIDAIAALHLGGSFHPQYPQDLLFRVHFEEGQQSRDMTLFQDDDGKAYHIYSSEWNGVLHIAELSDDYLSHTDRWVRLFPGRFHEAPAIMKCRGKYYLFASGCTGWAPNAARLAVADQLFGPWTELGNPCHGTSEQIATTFNAQSTFILPVQGTDESRWIFMADRWNPQNAIDGRYVWLPIQWDENGVPLLEWFDRWSL